ncbi:MAG: hypothetical protein HY298_23030 [Verrucomicrobia bacterium]|nr:hypothetical protein [Verrucomicrobiota bacterium]
MKHSRQPVHSSAGSVLLTTLCVVTIIGVTLASYLTLINHQNYNSCRSQAWNQAMPVLEAGIEEALTHLNAHGQTNLLCDGWEYHDGSYSMIRQLGAAYYVVNITNYVSSNSSPTVVAAGYVPLPLQTNRYICRQVSVTTKKATLFAGGIVAKGSIDLNGNNINTDSFDSADPAYSLLGLYNPLATKDNGDVVTNSRLTNSLSVGNARIKGKVATGPGGVVAIGPNGVVGSAAWNADTSNRGIEPGHWHDDMNLAFPDVTPPFSGGAFMPVSGVVGGVFYTYVLNNILNNGRYQMAELKMSGSANMIVVGDVTLYVTGNVDISGLATIVIAPGGHLKLYVGGPSTAIHGIGVNNLLGTADQFYYYGLPGNKSIEIGGNALTTVALYAPNADLDFQGGGNILYHLMGSVVCKSVKLNGHFSFHFDENLPRVGPARGYVATSWQEG